MTDAGRRAQGHRDHAAGGVRARDEARRRSAARVSARAIPARDRRRRVRRHRGPRDGRGRRRGARRRDPRRVRQRSRADRARGRRRFVFSGKVAIGDMADRLGVEIEGEGFETVGGYVLAHASAACRRWASDSTIDGLDIEMLEAERRRIHKVRIRRAADAGRGADESRVRRRSSAGRTPASPRCSTLRRPEGRNRLRQAADDAPPDSRRAEHRRRADRVHRHARHPQADAPHEPAHGGRGARHAAGSRRRSCWWSTRRAARARATSSCSDRLRRRATPVVLALNKIDIIHKPKLLPLMEHYAASGTFAAIVPISARPATACRRSSSEIVAALPEGEPLFPDDYLTDQTERTLAAELIREKVLRAHARRVAVHDGGRHRPLRGAGSRRRTDANLRVDPRGPESQKPIVVGKGGEMIKRIGTEARKDLEAMLEGRGLFQSAREGPRGVARR